MKEHDILSPKGRRVETSDPNVVVYVMPMGLLHVGRFSGAVTKVVQAGLNASVPKSDAHSQAAVWGAVMEAVTPFLFTDLLGLVEECVLVGHEDRTGRFERLDGVTVGQLPHWDAATVIEAWWDFNLGEEEMRRPWVRVIEKVVAQVTRRKGFRISDLFSKASSSQDTPSKTSSTDDSLQGTLPESLFRTGGGPLGNSGGGPTASLTSRGGSQQP